MENVPNYFLAGSSNFLESLLLGNCYQLQIVPDCEEKN